MPSSVIPPRQLKGRKHIEFIKQEALKIWTDTYNCVADDGGEKWRQSIKDALTIHRNYLKTGFYVRYPKYENRMPPMPPALPKPKYLRGSHVRPKDEGFYILDAKTNIWMPMQF